MASSGSRSQVDLDVHDHRLQASGRALELVGQRSRAITPRREISAAAPEASGTEALRSARIDLARRLRLREVELRDAVFARVRSVAPRAAEGRDLSSTGLYEAVAACVDCGLTSIEQGKRWSSAAPAAIAAQVHREASGGVGLAAALSGCVAGYMLAWSFVLNEVACHGPAGEQRFTLLDEVSASMSSVLVLAQAEIADAHSAEIRRKARSREQRRTEIVRRLLATEPVDSGELSELDYQLDVWHVALIATGARAKEAMRSLASELGRQVLAIQHNKATTWTWLGGPDRPAFGDIERAYSRLAIDATIAVGEPGKGLEGWRMSHHEAQGALLVANERGTRIIRYLDVALEAVALQDEALADSLIEKYLLPLNDISIGGQMACRVMRALFDAEHSVSSAANALGAHRSSVHRWREQIEQRLGYRLHERRAEIETALRVDELRRRSATARAASMKGVLSPDIGRVP